MGASDRIAQRPSPTDIVPDPIRPHPLTVTSNAFDTQA